ncbi:MULTISPECIES: flagellar hook-associated protein FlgK [unclassified Beijerinckia]|uniref:flagellar hook-associated protein FlgK n=1 Tax=unclassified Beijerinckia TaxID=2638183 RepID=UPI0008965C24|nr:MULTISPECIES: flagellar hook-associated protein FlgK [unclassified Beijerinckia]MDH7798660.1 flagellar hook-associated protein 1 FlgK [Beijerinckia sp. GAS462]SED28410.1 flagellar hook-associated protein 1 FlgK [Beijerinckia sp. 28-YEA-48]
MTLTGALNTAKSSLANASTQMNVTSRNIAGANDSSYSRKTVGIVGNLDGGYLTSITRATNLALQTKALGATSGAAASAALSAGLDQISQTIGTSSDGTSVSSRIASLNSALLTAAGSPNNPSSLQDAVRAAQDLAAALNDATTTVQGIRKQADSEMATSVSSINDLLAQFKNVNDAIVRGSSSNADITDQLDARDRILTSLSKEIGISVVSAPDNGMAIYTDSGVTLFDKEPRQVTFQPTAAFSAGTTGAAVMIDGVDVTSKSSNMGIKSGNLFGLAQLRDDVSVQYQKQLDETARGLINAFAESNQSSAGGPDKPGLFTWSGAPGMPPGSVTDGLAANISISASVDPARGGNLNLLRDGGISDPGNPAYVYNSSGGASYSGRLQGLVDKLSANQNFDPASGIGTSASVSTFATSSAAWLAGTRKAASDRSDQQSTIRDSATQALTSANGVDMNDELSRMLDIEHSYQASSKLISAIDQMFGVLFQAIG